GEASLTHKGAAMGVREKRGQTPFSERPMRSDATLRPRPLSFTTAETVKRRTPASTAPRRKSGPREGPIITRVSEAFVFASTWCIRIVSRDSSSPVDPLQQSAQYLRGVGP